MSPPRLSCDTSVYVEIILGPSAPGYEDSLAMLQAADRGIYEGVLSALVPAEVVGAPSIRAPQGLPSTEAASGWLLRKERSLLYVAATRARDELVILWSGEASPMLPPAA